LNRRARFIAAIWPTTCDRQNCLNTPLRILSADPKAGYLAHKGQIDEAIHRVLEGGRYILAGEVAFFEREFADYLGVHQAIGVGSGTEALHLALSACGIGRGDLVITVSHTAVATVAAIELAGAEPLLVDIEPETFTMDLAELEAAAGANRDRVKAVIPVHLYGHPADMPRIMEVAARHRLVVIEDCAQSHGATVSGRKTGAWGHMAAFSFYPTKNLGALGDGGALATNNPDLGERARLLRQYGWRARYVSEVAGMNSRLDEIQAAILRIKLPHLDAENRRRRQIANLYNRILRQVGSVIVPASVGDVEHAYHQYVIRSKRRDELAASLRANGVSTAILYPLPIHRQPGYKDRISKGPGGLLRTERICEEILSLPMHPYLSDDEVYEVGRLVGFATPAENA
jgi:dTDP-4-amino-4,6-dideoxygalactose transaminase